MRQDDGKKSILFIASNLNAGGIQNVISNLSESLNGDFNLSILLDNKNGMVFEFHGDVYSLDETSPVSYNNLFYQFRILIKRWRFLNKHRKEYDFVVSLKDSAHLPNILTKNKGGKTVFAVYSNAFSMSKVSWTYKYIVTPFTRFMYNKADVLFITSEGVRIQLLKYGIHSDKMKVIYDGVNVENIEEMSQEQLTEEEALTFSDRFVVCTLGRLDPVKGYNHLIKAFKLVVEDIPNAFLIIMGSGAEWEKLEAMVKELHLEKNVRLMGFVKNPYKFIRNSRLYAMSSVAEGFPTVLMEAMVCGTPIISTDMESGAREILAPNTDIKYVNTDKIEYAEYGTLVPVFEADDMIDGDYSTKELLMANGIIQLLRNDDITFKYKKKYEAHKRDLSHLLCAERWRNLLNKM